MKNARILLALLAATVLALGVGTGVASAADTFTGEVIDKACFDKQGAHGPEHADCAAKCIGDGGEVGLLTDGEEVILLKPASDEIRASLTELAAQQATVTGEVSEEDGMTVVTVTSVEAAEMM